MCAIIIPQVGLWRMTGVGGGSSCFRPCGSSARPGSFEEQQAIDDIPPFSTQPSPRNPLGRWQKESGGHHLKAAMC